MDTRDLDTDEVASIYDELLRTYKREWEHQGHRSLHLEYYDDDHSEPGEASINTMRVLSEAANITDEDRVLNIGCGAGEDSVWNARAHGATVIGVNISESQLELARENAREHDVEELTTFQYDDFHELSTVEDNSIDVVWGLEALSHSPDVRQVLSQAKRVLVNDGRVAFTDLFVHSALSSVDEERLRDINDGLGVRVNTLENLVDALEECEFQNIETREITDGIRKCTERRHKFSRVAHPFYNIGSKLGVASGTQADALKASSAMHRLVESGTLGYYIVTADC